MAGLTDEEIKKIWEEAEAASKADGSNADERNEVYTRETIEVFPPTKESLEASEKDAQKSEENENG